MTDEKKNPPVGIAIEAETEHGLPIVAMRPGTLKRLAADLEAEVAVKSPADVARWARELMDRREALFREPALEPARALCEAYGMPETDEGDMALVVLHHWRLRWLEATDRMLAESEAYLAARPLLAARLKGPPPLNSISRDVRRLQSGLLPLVAMRAPR